ncbi:MAG: gliding motility-associated protein GldE [Bacteroidota bacterium]|nr:MAG: gliding motility-associated protein GldE [Bacteroidota bacterium]
MEDSEPYQWGLFNLEIFPGAVIDLAFVSALLLVVLLLIITSIVWGSRLAFLSLSEQEEESIHEAIYKPDLRIKKLLAFPLHFLNTTIVLITFLQVGMVVLFVFFTKYSRPDAVWNTIPFAWQVLLFSFLILFSSGFVAQNFASKRALPFLRSTSRLMLFFTRLFWPFSSGLIFLASLVSNRFNAKKIILPFNQLSDALSDGEVTMPQEKSLLKGIAKFGNIEVCEIMQARVDVVGIDQLASFEELMLLINESGYSRIPVYEESFDKINGILYIKDLLPHMSEGNDFVWQRLIREPYFVPESKKINDLLNKFQRMHIHMAIVVDDYGGTSGIVTLEDILEEIVGEISDETDDDELPYKIIDDNTIIFEGKILLNDFSKVANVDSDFFDQVKGDADTLAGLILELRGDIPKRNDVLSYKNFTFEVLEVDKRRIKFIQASIKR